MDTKTVDYEYRAAWKAGVYEWTVGKGKHSAVTLTIRKGWVAAATTVLLGKWIDAWMVAEDLTGVLVTEISRGGTLHAHGVLVGENTEKALQRWQNERGFVVGKGTTDLMGWITYCFKAVTPETVIIWRRGEGYGESILTPADKPVKVEVLQPVRGEEQPLRATVPDRPPWW